MALLVAPVAQPAARAADNGDGLLVETTSTYRVEPDRGAVAVEVRATLTNLLAPSRDARGTTTYYFDTVYLPVAGVVSELRADAGRASVEVTEDPLDAILVRLDRSVLHGSPQQLVVTYDLVPGEPRSDDLTRLNAAYAEFVVVGAGDPGHAELRVEAPLGFELSSWGGPDVPTAGQQGQQYTVRADADDLNFSPIAQMSLLRRDALDVAAVDVAGTTINVGAWPGDSSWRAFAVDLVERALPVLADLTGRPLPGPGVELYETSGGSHLGYAGFYTLEGTIEVSDRLDDQTLVHELAHGWINQRIFSERWLIEGVTQELVRRAADDLDLELDPRQATTPDDEAAVPLNEWTAGDPFSEDAAASESWGYDASAAVVKELVGDLDDEQLAALLSAALDDQISYVGDGEAEELAIPTGWQYVLDLLTELGGVEDAEDLYVTHVLTPTQVARLADRDEAREQYAALLDDSGTWSAPFPLRRAMARWDFADVEDLIDEAAAVRARATAVETSAAVLGTSLPPDVELAYESDATLDDVSERLDAIEQVVTQLADTRDRRATLSPVEQVGLLGTDDGALTTAGAAVAEGDLKLANDTLAAEQRLLDDATRQGALRLAVVGLLLVAALLLVLRRRRRRRQHRESVPAPLAASHSS